MTIEKAQLKIHITNELGANIEDRLEGERKAMHELAGAAVALKQAAEKVPRDLAAHVDRELEEGKISDGLDAAHVVGLVKKYLTRVGDFLGHLADVEKQKSIVQGGRVAGLEEAVAVVKRVRDDTVARVENVLKAVEEDAPATDLRTQAGAARAAHGSLAERRAAAMTDVPVPSAPPAGTFDPPVAEPATATEPAAAETVPIEAAPVPTPEPATQPAEAIPVPTPPPPAPALALVKKGRSKKQRITD